MSRPDYVEGADYEAEKARIQRERTTRTTIPKPFDRVQWLAARHPYFNASDAGALYGEHPFTSLADVAIAKLKPEPDDSPPTKAMDRGNRAEPMLLKWWEDEYGQAVETPDVLYVEGRMMATLDGVPVGDTDIWIEAKTTRQRWEYPPDHVVRQVIAQGAASGFKQCHVVWLDADWEFKTAIIEPTDAQIADVLARAAAFMDFIDLKMMPEGIELSAENVTALYPEPEPGKYADLDDDGLQDVVRWEQARQARIAAEKYETAAKDAVAARLLDAEAARYDGRAILSWKANKPTERVDWKALAAAHPELVAEFTRTVPGARVLRATRELGEVA